MKVYVVTHTENDYYGDQEKYLGASLTLEGAKNKLLEVLNCTWEQLGVSKTVETCKEITFYVGQRKHIDYEGNVKFLDAYWHNYTITEVDIE